MIGAALALAITAADLNQDGMIDSGDLSAVFQQWNTAGSADLNNDGTVDTQDVMELLTLWRAGRGVHGSGDGQMWFVSPGDSVSIGPSPFPSHRRLRFRSPHGDVVAIDIQMP